MNDNDYTITMSTLDFAKFLRDSILADLTRKALKAEPGNYMNTEKLRFIYDIPGTEEQE